MSTATQRRTVRDAIDAAMERGDGDVLAMGKAVGEAITAHVNAHGLTGRKRTIVSEKMRGFARQYAQEKGCFDG
jgi:hypothetical protein